MKHFTASALALALFVILATSQTSAEQPSQSRCTAKFARGLAIRGIHLGMTTDELLAMFPELQEQKSRLEKAKDYPSFGFIGIRLSAQTDGSREKLAGINNLDLTLFDNRVVRYSVSYEGPPIGAHWHNPTEFLTKLSETLNLPGASDWVIAGSTAKLNCERVQIDVTAGGPGYIEILDIRDWEQQLDERQKTYHNKKRREFKP